MPANGADIMTYIYENPDWPHFRWQDSAIATSLGHVRHRQGRLIGYMQALGSSLREEASLSTLTEDIIKSSAIEGEALDKDQVRSSIARQLGLEIAGLVLSERHVDGVVEMMLDATCNHSQALTEERLWAWHAVLFPTGRSGMSKIKVGAWRDDATGPMQVISGPIGREWVHFQAPKAETVPYEMEKFLRWFDSDKDFDPLIAAAIAHLWFVTIHPFDDGNGRMARAVTDLALARSEDSAQRFYSMSSQIRAERSLYYQKLELTQKGDLDITPWLQWFLECLNRAFDKTDESLGSVMRKALFWEKANHHALNDRQKKMLNQLLENFEGNLTTSKWAKISKCSQDTASRDIDDLMQKGLLVRGEAGGRSTNYALVMSSTGV